MNVFVCTSEDIHPYECDGPGRCRHCDATVRYGDLCSVCRMDLAMEGDEVCASCAQELEPEKAR